jgi:hypothetical protein
MSFLAKLYWRYRLWRTARFLDKRLRRECGVSCLEVLPKKLTLTRYNVANNLFWDGEAYFPFWRGKVRVSVCSDDGERPSAQQLQLLRTMLCHEGSIRPGVEAALLKYYQTSVYNPLSTRRMYEELFRVSLPEVNTPAQMQKLLPGGPSVCIGIVGDASQARFELHFHCLWDEEHGVTVHIEDWKVRRLSV